MSESTPEPETFISEPIIPEPGSFTTDLMAQGLASLPGAFRWRNRLFRILECIEHTKRSQPEGGTPDGERYLRRQVFRVRLDTGQQATIYFLRSPPSPGGRRPRRRASGWFVYSMTADPDDGAGGRTERTEGTEETRGSGLVAPPGGRE